VKTAVAAVEPRIDQETAVPTQDGFPPVPDRVAEWGDKIWQEAWVDGFLAGMGRAFRQEDLETALFYAKQELLIIRMLARQFVFADMTCRYIRRYAASETIEALLARVSGAESTFELFGFDSENWLQWPPTAWQAD
jgi:hypothetical protein